MVVSLRKQLYDSDTFQPRLLGLVFATAALVRILLILFSIHHDATHAVKYTDIDYKVFSDASKAIVDYHPSSSLSSSTTTSNNTTPLAQGPLGAFLRLGDPYSRDTYRYTPLVALLLLPNNFIHPAFGKVFFALCDIAVAVLLYRRLMLSPANFSPLKCTALVGAFWLFNPLIANISTRGSSEAFLGVIVLLTLALAEEEAWDACALVFGLAVHVKIFPVIYATSLLAKLYRTPDASSSSSSSPIYRSLFLFRIINKSHIRFAFISFVSFSALNLVMWSIWGYPFISHTYLYHVHRLDHRHNFSSYFYPLYLSFSSSLPEYSFWIKTNGLIIRLLTNPLASFLPQLILSLGLGILAVGSRDLASVWFCQTMAFVTFNKVCTSQYFLWYLWLLPLIYPTLQAKISRRKILSMLAVWVAIQAIWLGGAFKLELMGQPYYGRLWVSSVIFFIGHAWVFGCILETL